MEALFCNTGSGKRDLVEVFYSESSNEKETGRRACHIAGNPGYGEKVDRDGPADSR
jgi:hypothetical protein